MRISDWSSDACSSDLADVRDVGRGRTAAVDRERVVARIAEDLVTLAVALGNRHREDVVARTAMHDVRSVAAEDHIIAVPAVAGVVTRSEERREGNACVSTCRTSVSPDHTKQKRKIRYQTKN